MTQIDRTAGVAGSFTFRTRNTAGSLITPVSDPVVTWYTDSDRTLGEFTLTVTGSGSSWTASWTAPQAPATPATRYLKGVVEKSTGNFDTDADDEISFTDVIVDLGEIVTVTEVKERLNKTSAVVVDDDEIADMIVKALAEYTEWVGPLSGTVVEKHDGGGASIILRHPNVASIAAAVYADGTVIDVDDLDLDTNTGIVYWGYNTAGYFTSGSRNVTLTYNVGTLPENHRETIVADVAGYFAATQRGSGIPGEGYEDTWAANPMVLFPRIRALAGPGIA